MDSVLFPSGKFSLHSFLLCLFLPCGHYLKGLWAYAFALVAGRGSVIHDLTPDHFGFGVKQVVRSHILCGRFWVRILYDDKINLPQSQGRSPTLIPVDIILYANNNMTYYVVWNFYQLIGGSKEFICLSNEIGNKINSRTDDQMIDCGRVCCRHYWSD